MQGDRDKTAGVIGTGDAHVVHAPKLYDADGTVALGHGETVVLCKALAERIPEHTPEFINHRLIDMIASLSARVNELEARLLRR